MILSVFRKFGNVSFLMLIHLSDCNNIFVRTKINFHLLFLFVRILQYMLGVGVMT